MERTGGRRDVGKQEVIEGRNAAGRGEEVRMDGQGGAGESSGAAKPQQVAVM